MRNNMNDNQELILKGRYTAYMEQIEKYYNGTIDRTQPIVIGQQPGTHNKHKNP